MMTTPWNADPSHSEVEFKVKRLISTTIAGNFHRYGLGAATEGEDFTTATKIGFSADVDSVSTKNAQRDGHWKSAELFLISNSMPPSYSVVKSLKKTRMSTF